MKKLRIFEYFYLAFSAVFLVEAVTAYKTDLKKFFILLLFSVIAILLYIYRKSRRIKSENENK
jgi:membrane protein DedA with SNARE-associated domain